MGTIMFSHAQRYHVTVRRTTGGDGGPRSVFDLGPLVVTGRGSSRRPSPDSSGRRRRQDVTRASGLRRLRGTGTGSPAELRDREDYVIGARPPWYERHPRTLRFGGRVQPRPGPRRDVRDATRTRTHRADSPENGSHKRFRTFAWLNGPTPWTARASAPRPRRGT